MIRVQRRSKMTPDILLGGILCLCIYCVILFLLSHFNSRLRPQSRSSRKTVNLVSEAGIYSSTCAMCDNDRDPL